MNPSRPEGLGYAYNYASRFPCGYPTHDMFLVPFRKLREVRQYYQIGQSEWNTAVMCYIRYYLDEKYYKPTFGYKDIIYNRPFCECPDVFDLLALFGYLRSWNGDMKQTITLLLPFVMRVMHYDDLEGDLPDIY